MRIKRLILVVGIAGILIGCETEPAEEMPPVAPVSEPAWASDAIFYQIFPERFRNGDTANDPDHASLEYPENVPDSWQLSPWTGDWYARDAWEQERGEDFYEDGVFDRRYGGDLQGVREKLDYLAELGINAIYFNPLFYARSLHKYDGNTFHHIDPYFGPDPAGDFELMATETSDPATWNMTAADQLFFDLVSDAHERGIRIVIDGVWNHTGRDFFAFADIRENQEASPYKDWYIINAFDDPSTPEDEFSYEGWWGVETLPLFADTPNGQDLHPGPKAYVFDATRRWMDPNGDGDPSDGVDGWRLDVAPDVPLPFWADWNALVRSINPEAYTVSEVWHDASSFLQEGGFSATMNYHGFAFPGKGYLVDNLVSASEFMELLDDRREEYPVAMQYALQNLMDSHDTDRLGSMIVNAKSAFDIPDRSDYDHNVSPRYYEPYVVRKPDETERQIQRLVALFQMTYVGPPMIYYGTESGMWGADDPDDRMPMVWEDMTYDNQEMDPLGRSKASDAVAFDNEMFLYYQSLFRLRTEQVTLRRGTYEAAIADDAANAIAFWRAAAERTTLVAINRGSEPADFEIPVAAGTGTTLVFETALPGSAVTQSLEEGTLQLTLPGLSGAVISIDA